MLQFVEPVSGTDDVRCVGAAALYAAEPGAATLSGNCGGWVLPEQRDTAGTVRRLVWSDLGRWQWEGLPQPAGLRTGTFAAAHAAAEPIRARATFTAAGIEGELSAPAGRPPSDALLATREGRLAVELGSGGRFSAAPAGWLEADEFVRAGLLTDEQRRRSRVFDALLRNAGPAGFPPRPTLLFWTEPWNFGFEFGGSTRTAGAALVAVPLELRRPPPGSVVTIPAALLPYREAPGPDGIRPSGFYDYRQRQWQAKLWSSSTWLMVQVPPMLLPFEPHTAAIDAHVAGPLERLEISIAREGQVVPVKRWDDPVGTLACELAGRDLPALDPQGALFLKISGGDPDLPELGRIAAGRSGRQSWRIESLNVELRGEVLDEGGVNRRKSGAATP